MIDILLSTYQSEAYIEEQLKSLFRQDYENWTLLIRDDGSTDSTINILENYSRKYPGKIRLIIDELGNIGALKSYEQLLIKSNSEYIMFCDHDDVWFEDKIRLCLEKMLYEENLNNRIPLLIHSDLKVVDTNLNLICDSFWTYLKINPSLLTKYKFLRVSNGITGCTMMINKNAKEVCLPFNSYARMHDSWIGIIISKTGKVSYINNQTLLYRQHSKNHIGAIKINLLHYIKMILSSLSTIIENNQRQIKLIKSIEKSSFSYFYYFYCKVLYFILTKL
jgi:glycosyltransferase involved in cell wall biosynthesis